MERQGRVSIPPLCSLSAAAIKAAHPPHGTVTLQNLKPIASSRRRRSSGVEDRSIAPGTTVAVYRLEIDAIMALPCIEPNDDRRPKLADELAQLRGSGSEPEREGLRTRMGAVENPTNHKLPTKNIYAEKEERHFELLESPREDSHLKGDPDFAAFEADQEVIARSSSWRSGI